METSLLFALFSHFFPKYRQINCFYAFLGNIHPDYHMIFKIVRELCKCLVGIILFRLRLLCYRKGNKIHP